MKRILLGIICSIVTISAYSSQYSFLKDTPAAFLTGDDWKQINITINKVLNHTSDGVKVYWKNPQTGNHGYMMASNTHRVNGLLCRNLKIANSASHRGNVSTYKVCKYAVGWKIPPH